MATLRDTRVRVYQLRREPFMELRGWLDNVRSVLDRSARRLSGTVEKTI